MAENKKTIIGDNDTVISNEKQDRLQSAKYVTGLTKFISNCKTPMTISMQGKWGTGKTSMMKMVENSLKAQNFKTIYFNTWQYSQVGGDLFTNFIVYLLKEMSSDILEELKAEKIDAHSLLGLVYAMKPSFKIDKKPVEVGLSVDQAVLEEYFTSKCEEVKAISAYKEQFQKIVNKRLGKEYSRFVFFIDDLDRLQPEKAIELLEIIKLFLEVKKCVFVIAIDDEVVIDGLKKKYGSNFSDKKGREYFDKIIQVPFYVPTVHYEIQPMLTDYLGAYLDDNAIKLVNNLTQLCTQNNPRTIKRVCNSFLLNYDITFSYKASNEENILLYVLILIQCTTKFLYDFIIEYFPEANEHEQAESMNIAAKRDSIVWLNARLKDEYNNHDFNAIEKKEYTNIYNSLIAIVAENGQIYEEFIDIIINNANKPFSGKYLTLANTDTKPIREEYTSIANAFIKSVKYCLGCNNVNLKSNDFNSWIRAYNAEKNNGKTVSRPHIIEVGDRKYAVSLNSDSKLKKNQLRILAKECKDNAVEIKWFDQDGNEIFSTAEKVDNKYE